MLALPVALDLATIFRLDLNPADRAAREQSVHVRPGAFADPNYQRRFIDKIDTSGGPEACWPWLAYRQISGYGRFPGEGTGLAHRISFAWSVEAVTPGLLVRHVECGNTGCTNPSHLAQGTHADNSADMVRQGHAGRGRILSDDDLAILDRMYWRVYKNAKRRRRKRPSQATVTKNLAREFDVSPSHLGRVIKDRAWTPPDSDEEQLIP